MLIAMELPCSRERLCTCMRPGMPCFASAGIGGRFCASTSAFICCGKVCAQGACTAQQTWLVMSSSTGRPAACARCECRSGSQLFWSQRSLPQQKGSHVAGEDLVQQHPVGIHIGPVVDWLPFQHLRRGISQRVWVPGESHDDSVDTLHAQGYLAERHDDAH